MRQRFTLQSVSMQEHSVSPLVVVDILLLSTLCLIPNLLMGISFLQTARPTTGEHSGWLSALGVTLETTDLQKFVLWATANLLLLVMLFAVRRYAICPMIGVVKQVQTILGVVTQNVPKRAASMLDVRGMVNDLARMTHLALEYYLKHQQATGALQEVRTLVCEISHQQATIVRSTSREMLAQHQAVLAYANYLEERITRQAADPTLRYDFDEVSESSFNLKIIAGALGLLQTETAIKSIPVGIPLMMQQTLLALAPSLDRRGMKLTTVEVEPDVVALGDPAILAHVLWMILLGTVRYAADESTLRMRCLYNHDRSRAILSIAITELCSSTLTAEEREAFLNQQSPHATPHMFAETIRIHGNIQLADMLSKLFGGELSVLPLTSHSCEICLSLPAGA
jgi:hypothetical protein